MSDQSKSQMNRELLLMAAILAIGVTLTFVAGKFAGVL
ncbi:hypothetical protein SAMN05216285_4192 [Natrinema salifodinae]|uniref:Uncharacterized protein n=1 Tax=Natrinema salifodinae TaxID=1202768 RepID=A0A1I0QZB2_9EURY|nr:hypothetical protein SAMN05216285_4192 [Natrinema salifodinae]